MLTLPAKMKDALEGGRFEPVVYAEITTAVLDAPPAQQTKSYYRTAEGAEGVELLYPAQGGDPVQSASIIYQGLDASAAVEFVRLGGGFTGRFVSSSPVSAHQTFTVGEDLAFAKTLKSVTVKFHRETANTSGVWQLRCRIYSIAANGSLEGFVANDGGNVSTAFGGGIESATLIDASTIGDINTPSLLTFAFNLDLTTGKRYAVLLYAALAGSASEPLVLQWWGTTGKKIEDWVRAVGTVETPINAEGSLDIKSAVYSYDGVTDSWVEYVVDLRGTPVSAGFIEIKEKQFSFFDPVTQSAKYTATAYHLWASNSLGSKDVDLGLVTDGAAITTLRGAYVVRASLRTAATGTLLRTPIVISINLKFPQVVGGLPKIYGFSSHALPFSLAPAVNAMPSIPTKLDPGNSITERGSVSLQLEDINGEVTRIATEENLLNLPVEIRVGHRPDAIDKTDLALVFSGKITDFEYMEGELILTIEDQTKKLDVRFPKPTPDGLPGRREYNNKELVDCLQEILANDAGISARYIDTASFAAVKTFLKGSDPVSLWITHRVIDEQPVEARSEAEALLQLIGCYLVTREDGLATLIQYPRSGASVRPWDASILSVDDKLPAGFAKTFVNQCVVLYDANNNGQNEGAVVVLDDTAQDSWAPGADRFIADRVMKTDWLGPEVPYHGRTLGQRIGKREVDTKKNGIIPFSGRTGIDQFEVQIGDFVDVTSPAFLRKNQLGMTAKQFMIISKDPRFDDGYIDWVLMEAVNNNRPPTARFTMDVSAGTPSFTVHFDGSTSSDPDGAIVLYEWDFDYDGKNFTVDATGVTPSHVYGPGSGGIKTVALRVTDNAGAQHLATQKIRVRVAPVPVIEYELSSPDQPLFASLSSSSYGITAPIVKIEWDLSYDGTFHADAVGPAATVNLPYQTITVALRVTDSDGLTAIGTMTFTGKTLEPADVSGFFVTQQGDKLSFQWQANPDVDLYAYEVRYKYEPTGIETATWNNSDLLFSENLTTHHISAVPRPYGTYTFLIKAINTTGRYSQNATVISGVLLDPNDRNILITRDEAALNWPGTKTQLMQVFDGSLWIDAPDTIGSIPDNPIGGLSDIPIGLEPGVYSQGIYECPPQDLGAVMQPVRMSVVVTTQSIPNPINTQAVVEARISEVSLVDLATQPYSSIRVGDLKFRYYQVRVTMLNVDGASNMGLYNIVTTLDLPDLVQHGEDVNVAIGGTTIVFDVPFNMLVGHPNAKFLIQNMTAPYYLELVSISNTQMTIKLRNNAWADVGSGGTRLVDWSVIGF